MAVKNSLTEEFLTGIKEVEKILNSLHFYLYSFHEKGSAYYIKYKKEEIILEFIFGPSDWDVEMIIFSNKGKFAFKDLLQISAIAVWVNNNRYKQESVRRIDNELLWLVKLFKFSLPLIS